MAGTAGGLYIRRDGAAFRLRLAACLDLLGRAWKLRDNLTAYDAMYVALAEALDGPIVTCDGPLALAAGHRARIELIA